MSRIQAILAQGRSFKDEEAERPSLDDIVAAERRLGVDFPQDYREFLLLGGLAELGFANRVLSPAEVLDHRQALPDDLLPFGSNGCGDLYVWPIKEMPEPKVYFWDHETGSMSRCFDSSADCLEDWRR